MAARPVRRVDAGCAGSSLACRCGARSAQALLGIDAAPGAIGGRARRAVSSKRARRSRRTRRWCCVDDAAHAAARRARTGQQAGACAGRCALQRRRREVQHRVGWPAAAAAWPAIVQDRPPAARCRPHAARPTRSALVVMPSSRQRPRSRRATRRPTSPQPTISRRGRFAARGRGQAGVIGGSGHNRGLRLPASPMTLAMPFTVTVQPSGRSFSVERDEPILHAAIRPASARPTAARTAPAAPARAACSKAA